MKGRPEAFFLEQFSEKFMDHVRQVCTFAKSIPGFKCLHHEVRLFILLHRIASFNLHLFQDQVSLLKSCVFEVLLVRLSGLFDNQVSLPSRFGAGALYRHLPSDRCPSSASVLVNPEAEFERAPDKKSECGASGCRGVATAAPEGARVSSRVISASSRAGGGLHSAAEAK